MQTEELIGIDLFLMNQSKKISDYKFRRECSVLYVLNKETYAPVFIILDVTDLNQAMSLAKCLLSNNDIPLRICYSIQELKQIFKEHKKSVFTENVEYEKKKTLSGSETLVDTDESSSQNRNDVQKINIKDETSIRISINSNRNKIRNTHSLDLNDNSLKCINSELNSIKKHAK